MESYERNDNFGASTSHAPEWNMTLPDKSKYRDVHRDSQIPKLKEKSVQTYLSHFDTSLQDKPKSLYKDKFLSYVRHVTEGEKTFIHAKCYSEMRKGTAYYVDVSLDQHGITQETQCDCGAGMDLIITVYLHHCTI